MYKEPSKQLIYFTSLKYNAQLFYGGQYMPRGMFYRSRSYEILSRSDEMRSRSNSQLVTTRCASHKYEIVSRNHEIVSRNYEIGKTYYVAHTGFRIIPTIFNFFSFKERDSLGSQIKIKGKFLSFLCQSLLTKNFRRLNKHFATEYHGII